MSIIIFLIILGILVLVHEFGHFIAAKKNGVLVEEFGFGFPPRLIGKKIGETIYSFNLIPFGGFVKLFGEEYKEVGTDRDLTAARKKRAFVYKPPSIKALIIVAGVLMNIILAVFLYYFTLSLNNFRSEPLPLLNNYSFRFGKQENRIVVGDISPNSPASQTKIQIGDIAMQAGAKNTGENIDWFSISRPDQFIDFVKNSQDKEIYLQLENLINGETKTIQVTPKYDQKLKRAIIGINLIEAVVITYDTPADRVFSGFLHSYNISAYNVSGLRYLFAQSFKQKSVEPIAQGSAGPIGIFKLVSELVESSGKKVVINLLNLLALLSLSLAITNMIPFPALDGGRFVMVLYEWITGRRFNAVIEKYLVVGGFLFLMVLALLVAMNDIIKIYR